MKNQSNDDRIYHHLKNSNGINLTYNRRATMARKIKNQDTTEAPEATEATATVVESEEQRLLKLALENGTLEELKDAEGTSEKLALLITVYTSLKAVLGDESPATINALANLKAYEPEKVKKAKKDKVDKEPKFNEGKEVRAILTAANDAEGDIKDYSGLDALQSDDRVSEELKTAITTFRTLQQIEGIPEQALEMAYNVLLFWGKKTKTGTTSGERAPQQRTAPHQVEFDGAKYPNLSAALRAAGYDNKILDSEDGTKPKSWNDAWNKVSAQFKKGDEATHEEKVFTRHWLTAEQSEQSEQSEQAE